ncbi:AfsR/SARP family transcriptional regulator [Micromonospora yasonensis]|uniref:AfsR/SARP family transcriptional regulator n=1 Tax=Micromonospora yasonensis TaxID=1128667 RepID=UPI002231455D|nr:AfsR/SARP family transcriptional regulator [Micromonospora yasonensis]MCW3842028.1 AfsR/SARP family transcriptional regulator [Micromonospora yasonensis]
MSLFVRLLGPVEVIRNGRTTCLRAVKQIALLAALAFSYDGPVNMNDLTGAVWPGEPPRSAAANLRNYASALRRTVGDRIVAHAGGYQLILQPGELDVGSFQTLASQGDQALKAGEPASAERLLTQSLALWRGPAVPGLPTNTALSADLANLEDQRLIAVEDLAQARLDLGHNRQVVVGLRKHLRQHPLRERPWAQLMLALYRSGDTVGALHAFTEARGVLRDELGIEPDLRLSALHRAILKRSPDLMAPAAATTPDGPGSWPVAAEKTSIGIPPAPPSWPESGAPF